MHRLRIESLLVVTILVILLFLSSVTDAMATPMSTSEIHHGPLNIRGQDSYEVYYRRSLATDAKRARYPGFHPSSSILKAGSIRREGAKALPCDILFEQDVPIKMRDGTVIYTDVFRPVGNESVPAIIAWSPYGKQIGGRWLDDMSSHSGIPLSHVSELQKFEGPDPAYWVSHGYAIVNPDPRGAYSSEGEITFFGSQLAEDGYDVVEAIANKAWSTGKVAFSGNSWLAISQWFVAAERPPHLAVIAP
ncbi:uncharacterized protein KD926_009073 [Aspergillus affinis]|uniref:uncharacterized protein n=1 Tax=Aspergillus affinis TaxID=1070780 RepID=UPI0022FDDC59|nr:uncharacterized protein KD926_009073 [Aspergillus affinis]KAI9039854.1 hypothetical protein KD926_009073 [Aspergillus affinis]